MIDTTGENVCGTVIGEMETREFYRFYSESDGRLLWEGGHFDRDHEAIDAFWSHFLSHSDLISQYKSEGVEMRVWK